MSTSHAWTDGGGLRAFALWQLPTLVFAGVLVAVTVVLPDPAGRAGCAASGLALIAVASVAALAVPWRRVDRRSAALLPCLDLAGAAGVNAFAHDSVSSAVLLCALPVVWLAFDFGVVGTVVGALGGVLVGAAPFLADADLPLGSADRVDLLVPPLTMVGVATVALALRRTLARAERALIENGEHLALQVLKLNSVLEAVDVAVSLYADGEEPLRNAPARAVSRRAGGAETGPPVAGALVFGADRTTPVRPGEHVMQRALGGEEFSNVLQWVGPPDDQVAIMFSARQMRTREAGRVGTVLAGWDATDLLDAIRRREDVLTNVSHELRTPLTSILGYLELMPEAVADDDVALLKRMHEVMQRNGDVLLSRIDQLLTATKDGGVSELRREVLDVAALLRAALAKHAVLAGTAGLDLVEEIPVSLDAEVDPRAFEQIVDNLVSNALKYTRRGSVCVRLDQPSDTGLRLVVADTGIGMEDADRRHATRRFHRADVAMTDAIPGIGLGLAITHHLVTLHGGRLDLASKPGSGTTVTVTIGGMA